MVNYLESIDIRLNNYDLKNVEELSTIRRQINFKLKCYKQLVESNFLIDNDAHIDLIKSYIRKCNADLKIIGKLISRANGYKKITFELYGDYDRTIETITFPIGTQKKFKLQWLKNNNYPIKTEYYSIDSMYDCTGEVYAKYVTHKANKVIIESLRDV